MNYNNKKFKPVRTSKNGETSTETIFHYKQQTDIITCEYTGGAIIKGQLIGKVTIDGKLDLRYHQINKSGELMTGVCTSTPEILPSGKIRLIENWQWTSGDKSKGQSIL